MELTTDQVIEILRAYNTWRRGAEIDQPDPKSIGQAIDLAIKFMEAKKVLDHGRISFRWNHTTKPSLYEVYVDGEKVYSGTYKGAQSIN